MATKTSKAVKAVGREVAIMAGIILIGTIFMIVLQISFPGYFADPNGLHSWVAQIILGVVMVGAWTVHDARRRV